MANGTMAFRVTVTNTAGSSTAVVNVDVTNIVQTPLFAQARLVAEATFPTAPRVLLGTTGLGLVGASSTPTDPLSFSNFNIVGGQLQVNASPSLSGIQQPALFNIGDVRFEFDPIAPQIGVVQEALNRFRILVRSAATGAFDTPIDVTIDKPCTAVYGPLANGQPNAVFVGQRDRGFSILRIDNNSSNSSATANIGLTLNTGQSFCALQPVSGPLGGTGFGDGFRFLQDLIAIDTDTNTINVFTQTIPAGGAATYILKTSVPIQFNAVGPLELIKAAPIGGFFDSKAGLAMVFTDGRHRGEHRLVIAGLDGNRNLVQQTYTWTVGVPVDVMLDNLDQDVFPEVIVATSSSPYAAVFESTVPGSDGFLPLGGPAYFETGLGASQALASAKGVLGLNGLYVAFPDKKQVRVFQPATP